MNPNPDELKKQLELEAQKFEDNVIKTHLKLAATHEKKEYTFSAMEKQRLAKLQTVAFFVADAIDDIINLSVLARLGIKPDPSVRIMYDIALGRFTIWTVKEKK